MKGKPHARYHGSSITRSFISPPAHGLYTETDGFTKAASRTSSHSSSQRYRGKERTPFPFQPSCSPKCFIRYDVDVERLPPSLCVRLGSSSRNIGNERWATR
ncbi:hypothetical protein OUZ56_019045 [Daphnia magna]|uniref:Uncharacterized protein n=1 Tax=Daphnia magna TaxID=35525 RepID=A0ABQ9ZAH3_9CRUS|nr:hypothetical protein OUZ56_019045 [Daphnia magna]